MAHEVHGSDAGLDFTTTPFYTQDSLSCTGDKRSESLDQFGGFD